MSHVDKTNRAPQEYDLHENVHRTHTQTKKFLAVAVYLVESPQALVATILWSWLPDSTQATKFQFNNYFILLSPCIKHTANIFLNAFAIKSVIWALFPSLNML